jgi:hypothetical protein
MDRAARLLEGIAVAWIGVVAALVLVAAAGVLVTRGWLEFASVMSPLNPLNWFVTVLLLLPAFGLNALATRLRRN